MSLALLREAASVTGTYRMQSELAARKNSAGEAGSRDFANWLKPEDIAHVIGFRCRAAAKMTHGASVPVFGNS